MINDKKIVCVIPARLASSRFPRKILALLGGKPLIQWVWESANKISLFDEVVFAIDEEETGSVIEGFGGKYFMTDLGCLNGTERLVELHQKRLVQGDIWVNWQADEPFLSERMIRDLLKNVHIETDVWTLKVPFSNKEEAKSPAYCKVVCDQDGFALYFSRSLIPFYRDETSDQKYDKHIGLYAYSEKALEKIAVMQPSALEQAEMLEQLRFLSHGLRIQVHETHEETIGIDFPEQLALAEKYLETHLHKLSPV